jgi:tRNA (cmo5U34)-methyltransferase
VLRPGGRFVVGDVVVPAAGKKGPIYIDWIMDLPDSVADQLAWLRGAGFEAEASSVRVDLAVFRARLSSP